MAGKRMAAFRIAPELLAAMRRYTKKHGASQSWQIEQALRKWFRSKRVGVKVTKRKRR